MHVVLVDTVDSDMASISAAVKRGASFVSRSGFRLPAMVTLNDTEGLYTSSATELATAYNGIPIFSAGFGYKSDPSGQLLELLDTSHEFDQKLRKSLMRWFIQYNLTELALQWNNFPQLDKCYSINDRPPVPGPVLAQDEQNVSVEQLLNEIKTACRDRDVQWVTTDSKVANYLVQVRAQQFPNLTVYYPVTDTAPTTRSHAGVQASVPEADMTEFSYQATINAAGNGHFVVCKMKADQNEWVTTPFSSVVPLASSPCAAPG